MNEKLIDFQRKSFTVQFNNNEFLNYIFPKQENNKIIDPFFDVANYTLFKTNYQVSIDSEDSIFMEEVLNNHKMYSRITSIEEDTKFIVTTPPISIKNQRKKFIKESIELLNQNKNLEKLFYITANTDLFSRDFLEVFEEHQYPESILELDKKYIFGSSVQFYLIIFSKNIYEDIFYGKIKTSDSNHNKWLFKNLNSRIGSKDFQKGFISKTKIIKSLRKIELDSLLVSKLSRIQLPIVELKDITLSISQINSDSKIKSKENSIYFSLIGITQIVSKIESFDKIPNKFIEITLNTELVSPEYIVGFLNSKLGKLLRESVISEGTIPFSRVSDVGKIKIKLPALNSQFDLVDLINKANYLKNELDFMEKDIWDTLKIKEIKKYKKEINKFDIKGNLSIWIESLPYPLAAILWNYISSIEITKRIEHLLFFFEAFSEFLSILLLSIFYKEKGFYDENKHNWLDYESSYQNWYEKATFGQWNHFLSKLTKFSRNLNNREKIFGYSNEEFFKLIDNKEVIHILNEVKDIRNSFKGHTGVSNDILNKSTMLSLESKLQRFQELITLTFEDIRLIKAISSVSSRNGNQHKIYIIQGSRSPFVEEKIILNETLYTDDIYIHFTNNDNVFRLLDFIRIEIKSGASYFYMNIENKKSRWVSYHYLNEPNVNTEISEDFFKVFK